MYWYEQAIAEGYQKAKENLVVLYREHKDYEKAEKVLKEPEAEDDPQTSVSRKTEKNR